MQEFKHRDIGFHCTCFGLKSTLQYQQASADRAGIISYRVSENHQHQAVSSLLLHCQDLLFTHSHKGTQKYSL